MRGMSWANDNFWRLPIRVTPAGQNTALRRGLDKGTALGDDRGERT